MLDQCPEKTDIIDAFAVGTRDLVESAIVPGFVDALGVNHKKAIAVGQLVEPSFCQPEHAAVGAATAV
jgi:hypothetical protein